MTQGKSKRCKDCEWFEQLGVRWGHCLAPLPKWVLANEYLNTSGVVQIDDFGDNDCDCFQPRKDRKEKHTACLLI